MDSNFKTTFGFVSSMVGACVLVIVLGSLNGGNIWLAYGQSSTATLSGTVTDESGAIVPGVNVTATNPATKLSRAATTSDDGLYTIPQLPPGTYTVVAQREGFSPLEVTGVVLNVGDQQALPIQLTVGQVGATITVSADAGRLQIQSESGERSDLVTNRQINDLALNGRNLLDLTRIVPGIVSNVNGQVSGVGGLDDFNINGTRGNSKELTIDGSSNVASRGNAQLNVTVNPDAIQEVKILTSNFQAEFGKAGGGFISYTTKSGTNEFHGTGRYFRRHDSLNANNFFNNARGVARPLYRYNYYGFDIGGPVYLPRFGEGGSALFNGKNKLYFFFNQEYYRQLIPSSLRTLRVPTERERNGDFSQTTDGNGTRIAIRDSTKPGTCTNANTDANPGACFTFNGRVNVIDPALFFRDGQAVLNIYPLPNDRFGGARYNYSSQISSTNPRREDILRVDYNLSDQTRLSARVINNPSSSIQPYGGQLAASNFNFPLTQVSGQQRPINGAITLLHSFSPTLTNEFILGPSRSELSTVALDNRGTRTGRNLTAPLLLPDSTQADSIPIFNYGAFGNQTFPTASIAALPQKEIQYTVNFIDNLTKVAGPHTIKTGIVVQRSLVQVSNFRPSNGNINFNNAVNNPLNTGHPYANALLGVYSVYEQANNRPTARIKYTNIEAYAQDTWKISQRLTLDFGMRFSFFPPAFDENLQAAAFNPDLFDPARAVRLYQPTCINVSPCNTGAAATTSLRAVDPANRGVFLSPGLIGTIVPNSGDLTNGIGQARNGYPKGGFESRGVQFAPRFGFAYNVFGDGNTVVRGGFGISYDRVQSNVSIIQITNPPTVFQPRLINGRLADLLNTGSVLGPPIVTGYSRDGKVPNIYSYSIGLQRNLGFSTVIDVAYVGTLGRHLPQVRNINAVPYFTTFQRAAQDSTQYANGVITETGLPTAYTQAGFNFSGARALAADFLRPYQGYSDINYREFVGSSNYNSLQVAVNRRFKNNFTFGVAYTFSKTLGTGDTDFEGTNPFNTRAYDYQLADFDRTHTFVTNYVIDVPRLSRFISDNKLARAIFDNYQISGISQFYSGTPFEIGFNIQGINAGQRTTGSYNINPGLQLRSDPQSNGNGLLIDPNAFVVPPIGDIGPYPRTYLRSPAFFNHDVSLFKNFPFGGEGRRYLQLRLEAFNVFNHTQFGGINSGTQLTFTSASGAQTIGTGIFNDTTGVSNFNNLSITNNLRPEGSTAPLGQFFGEYSTARDPRIIQLGVKLYF